MATDLNARVSVGSLVLSKKDGDNVVLLLKHVKEDYWELPGGKVEPGEDLYAASLRELREETGIILRRTVPSIICTFDKVMDNGGPFLFIVYCENIPEIVPVTCENKAHSAIGWFPFEGGSLNSLKLAPVVRALFNDKLKGRSSLPYVGRAGN